MSDTKTQSTVGKVQIPAAPSILASNSGMHISGVVTTEPEVKSFNTKSGGKIHVKEFSISDGKVTHVVKFKADDLADFDSAACQVGIFTPVQLRVLEYSHSSYSGISFVVEVAA